MEKRSKKTLDRDLGLLAVMAISLGAMLGSGIFVLPGLAVEKAGSALALAYLISALVVLPAALAKCEMATAMPHSGGTYLYVDRGIGPLAGTVVGMGTWFSLTFKSAFALVGLGAYCKIVFPSLSTTGALAIGICLALILLNIVGVKKSSRFQLFVVSAALLGLAIFAAASASRIQLSRFQGLFSATPGTLLSTAGFVFVSFAGVTKIASIAEEVRNPSRNLPLGILLSLLIATVLYVLISLTLVGSCPLSAIEGSVTPLSDAAGGLGGSAAATAMAALAVLTLTSMANSGLLSSSRYPLAMSRGRLLPSVFARINIRFRTPAVSIISTGGLLLLLIALVPVDRLAKLASAFQLLLFGAVNLSLVVMRESGARWYKPTFRTPGYPLVPLLGVVGCAILLATMGRIAWFGAAGIVCGGLLWYTVYARVRVKRRGAVSRLYGERSRVSHRILRPPRRTGVIIPIFDEDYEEVDELLPLAAMLAEDSCSLLVLRIEEVPDQLGLGDAEAEDPLTTRIADHVERIEDEVGVTCVFENVVTHNAKHVLYQRASEDTNWMVKGWKSRSPWRLLPDPMAWFIHHPPCNLLLFRDHVGLPGKGIQRFRRVLVLAEPGPHDTLVVHVADRLAQATGATVRLAYLTRPDVSADERRSLQEYHRQLDSLFDTEIGEPQIEATGDDLAAIIRLARSQDLLVLGAPPQSEARGLFRGSFEDQVMERSSCAVLRVMAVRGLPHAQVRSEPPEASNWLEGLLDHVEVRRGNGIKTKTDLLRSIGAGLTARCKVPLPRSVEAELWERERRQVTALGEGVAVPHATISGLDRLYFEVWVLDRAVDFQGTDSAAVDVCFVLLTPPGKRQLHLRVLAEIGRLLEADGFLNRLRSASDPAGVRRALQQARLRPSEG